MMAIFSLFVFAGMIITYLHIKEAQAVGVCYGRDGSDLPSAQDVVNLYKANGITNMRVFDPYSETLNALNGSNIGIILSISNDNLQALTDPKEAYGWVVANVIKYLRQFKVKYISVGNEISPISDETSQLVPFLLPALQNVQQVITKFRLQNRVKVSTTIESTGLLVNTVSPSESIFRKDVSSFINPIIGFLKQNNAPLLANIHPYLAYIREPDRIGLRYALFMQHVANPLGYYNLFDAMLDSVYYAIEKAGGGDNMEIIVSESGWPSAGGSRANVRNAATYYRNLLKHVKSKKGTIYKPEKVIETYLYTMFDENLKRGAEFERHFGVFNPDKTQKYNLTF